VKISRSIFEPLTQTELGLLRSIATTQPVNTDADPTVLDSLRERGYLIKTKERINMAREGRSLAMEEWTQC
jgi:hypothetical protein